MADMRALFAGSLCSALLACAASNAGGPERVVVPDAPQPVEVAKVEPAPEIAESVVPVPDRPDEEPETIPLTGAWAATFGHTLAFRQAMAEVTRLRGPFRVSANRLTLVDGGAPPVIDFHTAESTLDMLSRRYAAAYYAADATSAERVTVLEEAARTLLEYSKKLDDVGLTVVPAAFKTDHRLALTFEEVTEGPAKRWRSEGFQLAKLCVERSQNEHVDTDSAKGCKTLHDTYKAAVVKNTTPPKTKAPAECACNPGDPLCSSSMNGWCRPVR